MGLEKDIGKGVSLGIEIAVAVFLGAFVGYLADDRFGVRPVGLIVGIALGGAAGMWNAIKVSLSQK